MKKFKCLFGITAFCVGLAMVSPGMILAAETTTAETTSDEEEYSDEEEEMSWVQDDYDLLTYEEWDTLNQELSDIYEKYHYDAVLWISTDTDIEDVRKHAAEFMQEKEIGYGDSHEGMCIFNQPDTRDIAIVFRGDTQKLFPDNVQEIMIDKCKTKLKEDDMVGGYQSLINDLATGLERVQEGKKVRPMDIDGSPLSSDLPFYLLLSFVIMAIPTLIMTLHQVHKMKTKVPQPNANAYETGKGLKITEKQDMFLYSTISQTAKPKNDNNDSDSGSFSSGGESFSGTSSKY